ncbi:hypothetical protein J992_2637 [Acinetobacter baumannii 45075_6]|nr:hypothetical protein ACINCANBC1_0127 [Acinetobacter baumannii Canada BC1]EXA81682.1 hypothetical protein J523_0788 [Acinetobacter baumannii 1202252]EXC62944.1 hypothetical protein J489_2469 [Acinetobacter baumannii 1040094]EXE83326.1 hypothetical protein J590_2514 [Acinetobacter baumannii 42887]EXQ86792.1 hypothetical protein J670_1670 [Acinetobacter baumannii 1058283]EYD43244.1 hypothetical protein J919_2912 [Acinetobacter baumannii 25493_6]EYD50230.1 hypothetical protein J917_2865 [Acine
MPLRWTALRYFQSDALNLLRIYRQTNKDFCLLFIREK